MADEDVKPEETSSAEVAEEALPEEQGDAGVSGERSRESSATDQSDVEKERDQYRELAQRIQADFENYKKRMDRQEQDRIARAEEKLVIELLPVLDTIDLALTHDPNTSLEQVRSSLLDVLQKQGLVRVAELEAPFDPTVHEAVAHEPGDGEQRVSEILRAGYSRHGRTLRPAMVKVMGA